MESSSAASGIFQRGSFSPPSPAQLDETASFVLDDEELAPGQTESPSQISQGTLSVHSELEDTLAGGSAIRRASISKTALPPVPAQPPRRWRTILLTVLVLAATAAAAAWLASAI